MLSLPKGMKEYYGKNTEQMSKLLSAKEVPISVSGIMRLRLEQGNEFPDLWNHWYDTSDLVVYPKGNDKEMYIFLTVDNQGQITQNGRKALELIRPKNLASNCGAKIDKISSLGRKGLIKVVRDKSTTGRYLTQEQALNETVWRILARHPDEVPAGFAEDKSLLKEYEERVRAKTGKSTNMAVYLGNSVSDENILKAWCVGGLVGRSIAGGWYVLDDGNGRLLGIAPEALSALGKGVSKGIINLPLTPNGANALEKIMEVTGGYSSEEVRRALNPEIVSVTQILDQTCQTSAYAPDQIKKLQDILKQGGYYIIKR